MTGAHLRTLAMLALAAAVFVLAHFASTVVAFEHRQAEFDRKQASFDGCIVGGLAVGKALGQSLDDGSLDLSPCWINYDPVATPAPVSTRTPGDGA